MKLERVNNSSVSFTNHSTSENEGLYSKVGEICTGVGLSGVMLELIANQNPGLIVNLILALSILTGAVIGNIPEYKGK